MRFEWDAAKNLINQRKHGIRATGSLLLLVVANTVGEDFERDTCIEVVRIISARKAIPEERRNYENENG